MKTLPLLTIAAMLLLTTSCYYRDDSAINVGCTENCMTFNAKVTTGEGSITPLANTLVELGWSESSMFTNTGRLIGRGVTAADGSISFSFKAKEDELQNGSYYIKAQRGGGYITETKTFYIKQGNSTVSTNIHLPSIASVKVVYKNFQPVNDGDNFSCTTSFIQYHQNTGIGLPDFDKQVSMFGKNFTKADGAFQQKEITLRTAGNQYTYFYITKKKNGITTNTLDSAFVGRGQTKIYEIEY